MADVPGTSQNIGVNPTCIYHEYVIAYSGYRNSCLMMVFTFFALILLAISIIFLKVYLGYLPTGFIPAASVAFFILMAVACYLEYLVLKYSEKIAKIKHAERQKQRESRGFEMEDGSQISSRRSRESSRRNSPRSENRHIKQSRSEQRNITPNINEAVDSAPPRRGSRCSTPPVNDFEQAPPRRGKRRITPLGSESERTETRSESRSFAQSASGSQHTAPPRGELRNDTSSENEQRFVVSGPCTVVISPA